MVFKTEGRQKFHRGQYARLVGVLHRDENGSTARQAGTAADLALREGDVERPVDARRLAGRFRLRAKDDVDAREAREGKNDSSGRCFNPGSIRLKSLSVFPAITLAAILATGRPMAFATKGTVRDSRGLTSMT